MILTLRGETHSAGFASSIRLPHTPIAQGEVNPPFAHMTKVGL